MDVRLVVLEGKGLDTREFRLEGRDFVVGRAASCDLQIDHSRVSLEHCRISRRDDGRVLLEDVHSTYGTFLNERDVEMSTLHDGDRIRVGPVVLLCAFGSEASEARRRVLEDYAERSRPQEQTADAGRMFDPNDDSPIVSSARQIFDRITGQSEHFDDEAARGKVPTTRSVRSGSGKSERVLVEDSEGVALVNLLDRSLIHDLEIQQIANELETLINGGRRRIVIDFGNVRHMSSQAVGVLIQTQRRLKALGGLLKLCNPNPEVAEIFKITNLPRAIEIHVDEHTAMLAGWPETAGESPAAQAVASAQAPLPADPRARPIGGPKPEKPPVIQVALIIEVGKSKGKAIAISGPRYLIGRDPTCQLRPASEAVSRVHTRIELRGAKVYVRDMGTTNGTLLGTRILHGEEAEAHHGDRLQIGPLAFSLAIESVQSPVPIAVDTEDAAASWLLDGPVPGVGDTAHFPLPDVQSAILARQRALNEIQRIRHQVVADTTVVTILSAKLCEESQIAPVRHELIALLDRDVPKKVIIRMGQVMEISSLAIAMLLGHFQRLGRFGGGMRLCELQSDVALPVEEALLTTAVGVYRTAEEALRDPWPIT